MTRSYIPAALTETGEIMPLYNPRRDNWVEHFSFVDGMIVPKTAIGRVTVRLLQFNRPEQMLERQLLIAAGVLKTP